MLLADYQNDNKDVYIENTFLDYLDYKKNFRCITINNLFLLR